MRSYSRKFLKITFTTLSIVGITTSPLLFAHEDEQANKNSEAREITGEVVDMMCYVDHSAMGEKHGQSCGTKCIKNGGPVGIISGGKAYLVVGEHKPMNDELASSCGKTITLKGKLAERGGIAMLENAEIIKK